MRLSEVGEYKKVRVKNCLHLPLSTRKKLFAFGILPGRVVEIVFNRPFFPLIVFVNGVLLALDRDLSERIEVEKE